MYPKIVPVILSGGAGTRLWPLSRASVPKQFLRLASDKTLLEQTLLRCHGPSFSERPIIVGSIDHRGQLLDTLISADLQADVVLEPCRRNSCAAVVAGALRALEREPESMILVLAADHHIPDTHAFQRDVALAAAAAAQGALVTFGIAPQSAATGYGYILPDQSKSIGSAVGIAKFVEKPDATTAQRYISEGYLWNSGNFLFQAKTFIAEVRRLCPDVLQHVELSLRNAERDTDFIRLAVKDFSAAFSVSVDVGVMEKTDRAAVLPVSYAWSDIGTWDAVVAALQVDSNANVVDSHGVVLSGKNVAVISSDIFTAVIGCDDIVVVTTPSAVLVMKRGASEDVKNVLAELKKKNRNDLL